MSDALMRVQNVTRRLEGEFPVTLVADVNLDIFRGEFAVIAGPSGSGKSSLLYLLGLLDSPTSGTITLSGTDTSKLNADELADVRLSELGFVFQFHFLLPEFSALDNVAMPMRRLRRLSEREIVKRATALLESVGLGEHVHKQPRQMSGGQSQRVAIARALANDPTLILADEPTGNLDTHASANVKSILRELAHEKGKAVVAVTHDTDFAKSADRTIMIVDGRVQSSLDTGA